MPVNLKLSVTVGFPQTWFLPHNPDEHMLPLLFLDQSFLVLWSWKPRYDSVPSQHGALSGPLVGLYKREKDSTLRLVPPSLQWVLSFMLNKWCLMPWHSKQASLSLFERSFAMEVISVRSRVFTTSGFTLYIHVLDQLRFSFPRNSY